MGKLPNEDNPEENSSSDREEYKKGRRSLIKSIGVASIIGTTGVGKVAADSDSTSSAIQPQSCSGDGGYWDIGASDTAKDTYTASDGAYSWAAELASSIECTNQYNVPNTSKYRGVFRTSSEAISKEKLNNWELDARFNKVGIELVNESNTAMLAELTGDNLGVQPRPSGSDPVYPKVVEELFDLAVGEISDKLDYAKSGYDIAVALLNQSPSNKDKNGDNWLWDWQYSGYESSCSSHQSFEFTWQEGVSGMGKILHHRDYYNYGSNTIPIACGWDIYYDGTKFTGGESSTSTSNTLSSETTTTHQESITTKEEAIKYSPDPPKEPEEWNYHPVPESFEPSKIKVDDLTSSEAIIEELNLSPDDYVNEIRFPLWSRPRRSSDL